MIKLEYDPITQLLTDGVIKSVLVINGKEIKLPDTPIVKVQTEWKTHKHFFHSRPVIREKVGDCVRIYTHNGNEILCDITQEAGKEILGYFQQIEDGIIEEAKRLKETDNEAE